MRPLLLSQVAYWCEGRHLGPDIELQAVATDSRAMPPGSLFVALRGERFDAHEFVNDAAAHGAAALLVHHAVDSTLPTVLCADTQEALGEIAAGMQQGRPAVVVALTGSNGKTSVKTLVHAMLARAGRAYVNPGNRNNEIGLPLAVIDAPEDAEFAIYEMGAGKPGDIAYLASIAPPQVALVNNIAPAHIERMGSLLGIAETKAAIYEALPDDGIAVVNADDAFAPYFLERIGRRRMLRFGIENDADIRAANIRLTPAGSSFELLTPAGRADINLPLPGRHNVLNALAATGLALAAGAPFSAIVEGLRHAEPVKGRQVAHALANGAVLIDDSYNANPGSVVAAIAALAEAQKSGAGQAWLVLGDMAELGEGALQLHADIGQLARSAGITRLWTCGRLSAAASEAFAEGAEHFTSQEALIGALQAALAPDVRCLVKGSRSSAMDKVVAALLAVEAKAAGNREKGMLLELARWLQGFARFFALFDYITMRAILGALTALSLSLWMGPGVIARLAKLKGGQPIRQDGPQSHFSKAGTPTMGGALIIMTITLSTLLWADLRNRYVWVLLGVLVSFGLIGWLDDWIKIVRRDPNGLKSRHKYALQSVCGLIAALVLFYTANAPSNTTLYLPLLKNFALPMGAMFIVVAYFWIVGFSNAVNLTDGLDGLAIMPTVLVAGALGVFAYASGNAVFSQYLQIPAVPGAGELAIVCAAIAGAGLGFLWFNTFPAMVFMGDIGALALGAALGTIAVIVRQELILVVMGGIFVIETLSVMIQVASFKLTGKRVFRMAPIHHHFELKGWPEPRVIVRFWIISVVLVLVGLATLKVR